jgi:glucose-1-phosphate cytidylyltransferase
MKAVILAGGLGTRLSEETAVRPKPMVEIGENPILWHIMKIYYSHGIKEFIICLGYKGYVIKEYFANYCLHMSDVTITSKTNSIDLLQNNCEDWTITLVDTGNETMTGGRLKRVSRLIGDETFCLTYGDGVGNIDITGLIGFHRKQGTMATLTAVQPSGRFGAFTLSNDQDTISHFREKPEGDNAWINGGYFVLEPEVMEYISGDSVVWEREPLEDLAASGQLSAYRHHGFWHPMDTLRDKNRLEELWKSGEAPWKVW